MFVDIVQYRAAIGMFNNIKFISGKKSSPIIEVILALKYIHTCILMFLCEFLAIVYFPFCLTIFLILNCIPLRFSFPILEDFSTFQMTTRMYCRISLKFLCILISHVFSALIGWSLSISFRIATMLKGLLLLGGNVHKNPGPLSFCYWNLGGLPTDNFKKKIYFKPS